MAESLVRLKVESQEYDAKLKRATEGLQRYADGCRKIGATLEVVEKETLDYVKAVGQMETVSKTANGRLSEMKKAFTELSYQYKNLTDAEKQSPYGNAMAASLDQLKVRIADTKKQLEGINQEISGSKFGAFGQVIDGVGGKLGISGNLTELLTSKTALLTAGIGASVAVIAKATEAWAAYNTQLAKQDQITTVTTGLKGEEADRMTDQVRALADTYNVDFRQAINAANTLMTQFGVTGETAIQLIKDGMQGMIQGDGPKLLSMIQQFAPSFRDAGVEASQLVAVIQNSEGGLFTDQNMQAISMGIRNIRLMTKATSDALAQLGIDGQEMSKKMEDGSLTVFEALKEVAGKIEDVGSGSKAAGEVMQTVFGRSGFQAGTKLGEAIATLNTNLAETKQQTGELGEAYADLQTANERLNKAIRDCFEYDGWEKMKISLKTGLIDALSEVLELTIEIKNSWIGEVGKTIFTTIGDSVLTLMGPLGTLLKTIKDIKNELTGGETNTNPTPIGGGVYNMLPKSVREPLDKANALKAASDKFAAYDQQVTSYNEQIAEKQRQIAAMTPGKGMPDLTKDAREGLQKELAELEKIRNGYQNLARDIISKQEANKPQTTQPFKPTTSTQVAKSQTSQTEQSEYQLNEKAIGKLVQEYQDLATAAKTADDVQKTGISERMTAVKEEIAQLQSRNDELKKFADEAKGIAAKEIVMPEIKAKVGFMPDSIRAAQEELSKKLTTTNLDGLVKSLQEKLATSEIGTEFYNNLTAQLADAKGLQNLIKTALENGIDMSGIDVESIWKSLLSVDGISDEQLQSVVDYINQYMGDHPITLNTETGEVSEEKDNKGEIAQEKANKLLSGLQSVANGLQNIGIKIPDSVQKILAAAQGVMSVIQGVETVISVFQTTTATTQTAAVTGNTIALSALTAAVTANTAALGANSAMNLIPFFARGGIVKRAAYGYRVPGNDFSDKTPVMVSSGELILNRAQQGNIASQLEGSGWRDANLTATLRGEDLILAIDNTSNRQGRGEYVTSKFN